MQYQEKEFSLLYRKGVYSTLSLIYMCLNVLKVGHIADT
jgi:hypothetical protein